eukprot:SAG11_NODE_13692_length_643_cov_1.330882_1_plen_184_part_00
MAQGFCTLYWRAQGGGKRTTIVAAASGPSCRFARQVGPLCWRGRSTQQCCFCLQPLVGSRTWALLPAACSAGGECVGAVPLRHSAVLGLGMRLRCSTVPYTAYALYARSPAAAGTPNEPRRSSGEAAIGHTYQDSRLGDSNQTFRPNLDRYGQERCMSPDSGDPKASYARTDRHHYSRDAGRR